MHIPNPFLHCPMYEARVIKVGGGSFNNSGITQPMIFIPVEAEEVAAVVCRAIDDCRKVLAVAMYYDGGWYEYDKDLEARLMAPPELGPEPEVEPECGCGCGCELESMPEPESLAEPESLPEPCEE